MLSGLDVSHHQGPISWERVAAAGHKFAIIKATEGMNFRDRLFNENLVGAQNAEMVAGAYHFLRSDSDAEVQANHFLDTVGRTEGILCALDVESYGSSQPTIAQVYKFAHVFRHRTHGHPLIIYTGRWYWVGVMNNPSGVALGPLWHSAYTRDPGRLYGGWPKFTFWQYTSSGRCAGIEGNVDHNWFYGGISELRQLTTIDPVKAEPKEEIPEMILVQNAATGAVLLFWGQSLLIMDQQQFKNHLNAGIPHVSCSPEQFKRYEKVRIDVTPIAP